MYEIKRFQIQKAHILNLNEVLSLNLNLIRLLFHFLCNNFLKKLIDHLYLHTCVGIK